MATLKPKANHTLLRHWHLLRKIPRYPRTIRIDDLWSHLEDEHFKVTRRTIEQRDLQQLSAALPIDNDGEKPAGWHWLERAQELSLPALTATEALTFKLVKEYLENLMPSSVLKQLDPFFDQAENVLQSLDHPFQKWPDKIVSVPPSQPLLPSVIDPVVHENVSDALLYNKPLRILYQSREQTSPKQHIVYPLAIVTRGGIVYLMVTPPSALICINKLAVEGNSSRNDRLCQIRYCGWQELMA